ncbi:ankyrin repeat domain-containing protein [Achromobacter marplatensis]|uniref:ankyrin repeat domain-containing protein n=1 Tax=Achromobacter marplatensis TaxID=470868 RepID=UPI0002780467|nr:ankyrin repeat domain-containing protein [Achromobacter marplatensis]EJO27972.1 hypothetical protein QWC_29267 [Achromobacter marplatensis]
MPHSPAPAFNPLLAILSGLSLVAGVIAGIAGLATNSSGGMFPNLALALGLMGLGLGNAISFLCNLLAWRLGARLRWLRIVLIIQALPTIAFAAVACKAVWDNWLDRRSLQQRSAIWNAVRSDDVAALTLAQQSCAAACREGITDQGLLMNATMARAHQVASHLIAQGATVSASLTAPSMDLYTCEGRYLPALSALSVAIAKRDDALVALLLPASDMSARREAMWTAATLDRLDTVKMLAANGVPLTLRGKTLDQNDTLLVAAASGAATTVGRWLIDTQGLQVDAIIHGPDPYPGTAPITALSDFMRDTQSPRAVEFLRLLRAHGADLDARPRNGTSALEEAVRIGRKPVATQLIDAGANPALLPATSRTRLAELLAGPDEPAFPKRRTDCVPP